MAKQVQNKFDSIKNHEKRLKSTFIVEVIFSFIAIGYFSLTLTAYQSMNPRASLLDALSAISNIIGTNPLYFWPITYDIKVPFAITILVCLFEFVFYSVEKLKVHHNLDNIKGSTKWANNREILKKYADFLTSKKNNFTIHSARETRNNILLSENIAVSMNTRKHNKALNSLIIGTSGTGKSRFFLKPNILQMNSSYIVTDPKGEILESCGEALRRNGYDIKVFDVLRLSDCDTYNPLKYCRKESDIRKVVMTFLKNVKDEDNKKGNSADPFWDESTAMFLCACVGLLTQIPEGSDVPYGQMPEITGGKIYRMCFASLCEFTRMVSDKWKEGCGIELLDGVSMEPDKEAPQKVSKIGAMFENMRMWEAKRQNVPIDRIEEPYSLRLWQAYWTTPQKTSETIKTVAMAKLNVFDIQQVRDMTNTDTIDLDSLGTRKVAVFCIIPPTDKTYNFLTSLLYTQLFDILYDFGSNKIPGSKSLKFDDGELVKFYFEDEVNSGFADKDIARIKSARIEKIKGEIYEGAKKVKKKKYLGLFGTKEVLQKVKLDDSYYEIVTGEGEDREVISRRPTKEMAEQYLANLANAKLIPGRAPALPIHVRFLLDEFPNIGEIPEFLQKLSTMRGYEISSTVICQSITQLKGMYPDDYSVVDANCPFFIFLGSNENDNNKYLSEKAGNMTVKSASTSIGGDKKTNSSYQVDQRQLFMPEEFGRLDKNDQILFINGEMPIYDKKIDYARHKNYKYTFDYADEIGCRKAYYFDREKNNKITEVPVFYEAEFARAIPNIKPLTLDSWKAVLRVSTPAEIPEATTKSYVRKSIIDSVVSTSY